MFKINEKYVVSLKNKYKILKKSQYYFNKTYSKANIFELFLIRISAFITKLLLYIKYLID